MERRDSAGLTPAEGRRFAFPVGGAFLVIAAVLYWWRGHEVGPGIMAGIGASLIVAGVVVPGRLGPVWRAWMGLAHILSKVTTPIFMGVVYYGVLTPTGLLRRSVGQNPIRHAAQDDSYWAPRPDDGRRSDLERQF